MHVSTSLIALREANFVGFSILFTDEEAATRAANSSPNEQRMSSTPPSSPLPVAATRVPSFRNGVTQAVQPRSLRPHTTVQRYRRRHESANASDVPALLKYFRRPQPPRAYREAASRSSNTQDGEATYFLATPVAQVGGRRPISSAVSSSSVVYSEINEVSSIPAAYCCAQHSALTRQNSYTPPPSYVDCMM